MLECDSKYDWAWGPTDCKPSKMVLRFSLWGRLRQMHSDLQGERFGNRSESSVDARVAFYQLFRHQCSSVLACIYCFISLTKAARKCMGKGGKICSVWDRLSWVSSLDSSSMHLNIFLRHLTSLCQLNSKLVISLISLTQPKTLEGQGLHLIYDYRHKNIVNTCLECSWKIEFDI